MSHFSVMVRVPAKTPASYIEKAVAKMLQPFHEFECTGVDDEYVQNIDETVAALASYESSTSSKSYLGATE